MDEVISIEEVRRRIEAFSLAVSEDLDLSRCTELKDLSGLLDLQNLRKLWMSGCSQVSDLRPLAGLTALQELDLGGCNQVSDLRPLTGLSALQHLTLIDCDQLSDLRPLAGLIALQYLNMSGCIQVSDLRPLAGLTALKDLRLSFCDQLSDLRPLAGVTALQHLSLTFCGRLSDLRPLAGLKSLQYLEFMECTQVSDLRPLADLTALRDLKLSGCDQVSDLGPVARLTSLHCLEFLGCSRVNDFRPLAGLTALRELYLSGGNEVADIGTLAKLTAVQRLSLVNFTHLVDLRPLAGFTALNNLDLSGGTQVSDLRPLTGHTGLQRLSLGLCPQVSDLRPISRLTALEQLDLSNCPQVSDLRPISRLTALEQLHLSNCRQVSDLGPLTHLTALLRLDLSNCRQVSDLRPLTHLTALLRLDLSGCSRVSDLRPLTHLTALSRLDLSGCSRVSDLRPLTHLTALSRLDLSGCFRVSSLSSLAALPNLKFLDARGTSPMEFAPWLLELPSLEVLYIDSFRNVPVEVQSANSQDNCLSRLRAWWADQQKASVTDPEVKVFILGNGGAGKTQLCRFLEGLPFDETIPTTHGIKLASLPPQAAPLNAHPRINIWDFGGQDVYHGTHALFLKSQAVFLILWTPELEGKDAYTEDGLKFRHKPLAYWMDYVCQLAGEESPVIIVQSQCEERSQEKRVPDYLVHSTPWARTLHFGARNRNGVGALIGTLQDAINELERRHPAPPLGKGWIAVRDELRGMLNREEVKVLEMEAFQSLCSAQADDNGQPLVSSPGVLLEYLHRSGVVFYKPTLFGGRIILDQSWALDAIYTIFDRKRCLPWLQGSGRFTRSDLHQWVWRDAGFSKEEELLFLSMMESCGICFPLEKTSENETVYLAPELLPARDAVRDQLAGRLRESDLPRRRAVFRYRFLHEGITRQLLATLGRRAQDAAVYWRNGCWLYDRISAAYAVVEAREEVSASEPGRGVIELQVYGNKAEPLFQMLSKLVKGMDPKAFEVDEWGPVSESEEPSTSNSSPTELLAGAEFTVPAPAPRGSRPAIFVSYAWGDNSPSGEKRKEMVDKLCERLDAESFNVQRDCRVIRYGESIQAFMKNFGTADQVVVILSDKYLMSSACMYELYSLWQSCNGDADRFRKRVHPLILDDATIGNTPGRLARARHWKVEKEALEAAQHELGAAFGVEDQRELKLLSDFALHVSDILRWMNDVLMPRGFDGIEPTVSLLKQQ